MRAPIQGGGEANPSPPSKFTAAAASTATARASIGRKDMDSHAASKKDNPVSVSAMLARREAHAAARGSMGRKDKDTHAAARGSMGRDTHATGKKEKPVSVSAMLARMDAPGRKMTKPTKPKSSKASTSSKSYLGDDVDLPPSDDEDDEADLAARASRSRSHRAAVDLNAAAPSVKDVRKKERREHEAAARAEAIRREVLRDDRDAFSVAVGAHVPADDGAASAADNVRDIVLENFSVSAAGVKLFDGASLRITHGQRYGLVGPNGKGKSTLLKLLAWRQLPVPRNIDVLLVEQEVAGDSRPAIEAVIQADDELTALRSERDKLEASDDARDNERLAELYEMLNLHGADAARARASKILAGLGFDQAMQARATKSFSGGWRMRISLARALFMQPTLLLLDEPTNHLDLRAVLWLEQYLSTQWKKTLIVVSHDRDFLNSVCNEIIHLHDKKLDVYRGSFDDFEGGFEQRRAQAIREHGKYQKLEMQPRKVGTRLLMRRSSSRLYQRPTRARGRERMYQAIMMARNR